MNSDTTSMGKSNLNVTLPVRTLLVVLICYVTLYHVVYFHFDGRAITDHGIYFTKYFGLILDEPAGGLGSFASQLFSLRYDTMYPLVNALLVIASRLFGADLMIYQFFNIPFYILLLLGGYVLGKQLVGKNAGLACAFAIATFPVFDNFSKTFHTHFHSVAILIWAFVIVMELQAGRWNYLWGVLLGLVLGLSFLTHPVCTVQSLPVLLFLLFQIMVYFRKDSPKNPAPFWVSLSALSIAALLYSPMIVRIGHYYTTKKHIVFPDAASVQAESWPGVLKVWYYNMVNLYLGQGYMVAAFVGLCCVVLAIAFSRKKPFPLLFLSASIVFQLLFGVWTKSNHSLFTATMIAFVLLPALVAGGVAWLYRQSRTPRLAQVAIIVGTTTCLLWGMMEKGAVFSADNDSTTSHPENSHLFVFHERDLPSRILDYMVKESPVGSMPLSIGLVEWKDGSFSVASPIGAIFKHMQLLASINGRRILPAESKRHTKEVYQLYYLPLHKGEQKEANRQRLRQMIAHFQSKNGNSQNTWFVAAHPYDMAFVDERNPELYAETVAVLVSHAGADHFEGTVPLKFFNESLSLSSRNPYTGFRLQ